HAEPGPSASETCCSGFGEIGFKCLESTKVGVYRFCKVSGWFTPCFWRHDLPEKTVVIVSSTIIPHCGGIFGDVLHDLLYTFTGCIGILDRVIEIGNIGLVVLAMMD